jgi:hypothetical protein
MARQTITLVSRSRSGLAVLHRPALPGAVESPHLESATSRRSMARGCGPAARDPADRDRARPRRAAWRRKSILGKLEALRRMGLEAVPPRCAEPSAAIRLWRPPRGRSNVSPSPGARRASARPRGRPARRRQRRQAGLSGRAHKPFLRSSGRVSRPRRSVPDLLGNKTFICNKFALILLLDAIARCI